MRAALLAAGRAPTRTRLLAAADADAGDEPSPRRRARGATGSAAEARAQGDGRRGRRRCAAERARARRAGPRASCCAPSGEAYEQLRGQAGRPCAGCARTRLPRAAAPAGRRGPRRCSARTPRSTEHADGGVVAEVARTAGLAISLDRRSPTEPWTRLGPEVEGLWTP